MLFGLTFDKYLVPVPTDTSAEVSLVSKDMQRAHHRSIHATLSEHGDGLCVRRIGLEVDVRQISIPSLVSIF